MCPTSSDRSRGPKHKRLSKSQQTMIRNWIKKVEGEEAKKAEWYQELARAGRMDYVGDQLIQAKARKSFIDYLLWRLDHTKVQTRRRGKRSRGNTD